MTNRDAFSACHPAVSFLYFALMLVFSMFLMHPASLVISLAGAVTCNLCLNGKKALRFQLRFLLPMLLMEVLPRDKVRGIHRAEHQLSACLPCAVPDAGYP